MEKIFTMDNLEKGKKAIVVNIEIHSDMRRRMQDIGLTVSTVVECVGKSPLGDLSAFFIRGAVVAIRSEDSRQILVKEYPQ